MPLQEGREEETMTASEFLGDYYETEEEDSGTDDAGDGEGGQGGMGMMDKYIRQDSMMASLSITRVRLEGCRKQWLSLRSR